MYGVVNIIVEQPVLHRQNDRKEREAFYKENGKNGNVFDTLIDTGIADDFWVCDFCNAQIEVIKDKKQVPVFIHGSYALCKKCLNDYKEKYPEEFQIIQKCNCCSDNNQKEEEE